MSTLNPAPVKILVVNITNGSVIINSNLLYNVTVSLSEVKSILIASPPSTQLGSIINTNVSLINTTSTTTSTLSSTRTVSSTKMNLFTTRTIILNSRIIYLLLIIKKNLNKFFLLNSCYYNKYYFFLSRFCYIGKFIKKFFLNETLCYGWI
jgi:hypothetical protein